MRLSFIRDVHARNLLNHHIGFVNHAVAIAPVGCFAIPVGRSRCGEVDITRTILIGIIQIDEIIGIVITCEVATKDGIVRTIPSEIIGIEILSVSAQRGFRAPIGVIGLLILRVLVQKIVTPGQSSSSQQTADIENSSCFHFRS